MLVRRQATFAAAAWPAAWRFPLAPVVSVDAIAYKNALGTDAVLDPALWRHAPGLDASIAVDASAPPILPGSEIVLTATVGESPTPASAKAAILLLAAELYEQRQESAALQSTPAVLGANALLAPLRVFVFA